MNEGPYIVLNGTPTVVRGVRATTTLLDWLRDRANLRGTKEGCAEGDCGACTVVLERPTADGRIGRYAVNACITMVGQIDGLGVRTVEGLSRTDGSLHPIQKAFAEGAGTQCGFCTPGFVMAAFAFANESKATNKLEIHDAIAGNLCRCTGYRPMIDAISDVLSSASNDPLSFDESDLYRSLTALDLASSRCFTYESQTFYVPCTLEEALRLRAEHPESVILAGGTDLGLRISRDRAEMPSVIYLGKIPELRTVKEDDTELVVGATTTYSRLLDLFCRFYPQLTSYLKRIGSPQIRNAGTLGGNIGTASSIGDMLPILIALSARIRVRSLARGSREVTAEAFFVDYRKTALAGDELIVATCIPKPASGSMLFVDKVSKRYDQDISAICGAYLLSVHEGVIHNAHLAFGGLANVPKRAEKTERAIVGRQLDDRTIEEACAVLPEDFQPISDVRGSTEYRLMTARNLLRRLQLRITKPDIALDVQL